MHRDKITTLENWKVAKTRKPLILKGARQVGKTWLVRELGKSFESFIEINLERNPQFSTLFQTDLDPRRIFNEIVDATGKTYEPDNTLLFLDEAQTTPAAIKSLRYFYEELPELHVICAGSLLDFAIEQIPTGVGRLTYLDLYPLTFGEYLIAVGEERLRAKVREQPLHDPLLDIHHQKLLQHLHRYLLTGGMPEVVKEYIATKKSAACSRSPASSDSNVPGRLFKVCKNSPNKAFGFSSAVNSTPTWDKVCFLACER